jgi:hypothetical protein
MPNTFATFPLVDPRIVRDSRMRFRRDEIPELAYANSFFCPSGRWPARGWILVRRPRRSRSRISPSCRRGA